MRPVESRKNLLTKCAACNGLKAGMAATEESVSGQHGAVQRRARRCHVRKQPWSRPVECLSVLRKMLQNMEKFTSWSVEKRWDPVAFWEVWQEQERMQGMWRGFVPVDTRLSPF